MAIPSVTNQNAKGSSAIPDSDQQAAKSNAAPSSEGQVQNNGQTDTMQQAKLLDSCKSRFGYTDNALGKILSGGKTPYEQCTDGVKKSSSQENTQATPAKSKPSAIDQEHEDKVKMQIEAAQNQIDVDIANLEYEAAQPQTIGNTFPQQIKP